MGPVERSQSVRTLQRSSVQPAATGPHAELFLAALRHLFAAAIFALRCGAARGLPVMNGASVLGKPRHHESVEQQTAPPQYTAKDFQLEVLSKLGEMESFAGSLEESWSKQLEAVREQRLLKFDSRTLIALAAIALSVAGYVVEDARNSARLDREIEATKGRVMRLEQIAATNTEVRIRTAGQLARVTLGEDRSVEPEWSDVRRPVIEGLVNAGIAVVISVSMALHRHWWK